MYLLVDDERSLTGYDIIARNPEAALEILHNLPITGIGLDNDMGEAYMEGWEFLKIALQDNVLPDIVYLVTSNPVAFQKMKDILEDAGYVSTLHQQKFEKVKK